MTFTLRRHSFLASGIFGEWLDENFNHLFVTLEHAYPDGHTNGLIFQPKIPPGRYNCERRHSPHFGYDVFWLTDVPDCEWIEIHIGNYNHDSEGCILLGMSIGNMLNGGKMLQSSKAAFDAFMKRMNGVDKFQLVVENE